MFKNTINLVSHLVSSELPHEPLSIDSTMFFQRKVCHTALLHGKPWVIIQVSECIEGHLDNQHRSKHPAGVSVI